MSEIERSGIAECDEEISSAITIHGRALDKDAADDAPVWQIWLRVKTGVMPNLSRRIWATKDGKQNDDIVHKWSDRNPLSILFPTVPFIDTLATRFNGDDGEMRVEHDDSLNRERTDPITLSAWITPVDVIGSQTILNKESNDAALRGYGFLMNTSRLRFICRNDNATANRLIVETGANKIIAGVRSHALVTYDGTSTVAGVKLYINGIVQTNVVVTDALAGTIQNTEKLRIGRRSLGDSAFDGLINEVAMFNRVLTLPEIGAVYSLGKPQDLLLHAAEPNIISYWRMGDNGIFPIITDMKGSNHGTLINLSEDDIVPGVA